MAHNGYLKNISTTHKKIKQMETNLRNVLTSLSKMLGTVSHKPHLILNWDILGYLLDKETSLWTRNLEIINSNRGSHLDVFLGKGVLKICSKFTGEHPCRSVILQFYLNHTSAWLFFCKFAAYFQNTFRTPGLVNICVTFSASFDITWYA